MGYCGVRLMSVRGTVWMGYYLVGVMPIGPSSMGCCPVSLLSSRVTVRSGYCLSDKCPSGYCLSECVLGEVSMGLVFGRATVRILLHTPLLMNKYEPLPTESFFVVALWPYDTRSLTRSYEIGSTTTNHPYSGISNMNTVTQYVTQHFKPICLSV